MPAAGGMGREPAAGSGLLHNMSAPPRLKITLNPIQAPPRAAFSDGVAAADQLPQGLRLVARVDLEPFRARVDRGLEFDCRHIPGGGPWARRHSEIREMARLILITRMAQGLPHQGMTALARRSHEYLADELRRRLQAIDAPGPGMPAFAIVCRGAPVVEADVPLETDPARALSLVARVTGSVYVARREPRVASLLQAAAEYRFYAAPGKETS